MLREHLVATEVGLVAQRLRDLSAICFSFRKPQHLSCLANEIVARHLVTRLVMPGRVFVDVGAHIGSITNEVLRRSNAGKVVAIEANPSKVRKLRKRFPMIDVFEAAVSDQEGEGVFYLDTNHTACSSLSPEQINVDHRIENITVACRTLDTILTGYDVDVIKLDVEGFELAALRGGTKTLQAFRPTVMFESGPGELLGMTKGAIWDWLSAQGYIIFLPVRMAHDVNGLTRDAFLDAHRYPFGTLNYFAVAQDRREEIHQRAVAINRDEFDVV